MNKKILSLIIAFTLAANTAKADDDVWWAVGGFILGSILSDNDRNEKEHQEHHRPPERAEIPPPRRQPRVVPIYTKVCQVREQYDPWGNPLPPIRTCWEEITGYREVYE